MDWPVILIKITGCVLFIWTMHSIYTNVKKVKQKNEGGAEQSVSEQLLNNLLLIAWLTFMTAFSLGMIFNN